MIAVVAGGDDGAALAVRPAGANELEVVLRVLRETVVRPRGDAGTTWGTQFPDVDAISELAGCIWGAWAMSRRVTSC